MSDEPASRPAAAFAMLVAAMTYEAREVFRVSSWSPPLGGGLGGALEHAGTPSRRGQGERCVKPVTADGRHRSSESRPVEAGTGGVALFQLPVQPQAARRGSQ